MVAAKRQGLLNESLGAGWQFIGAAVKKQQAV
jgi:hypothetical protein